jgi:O-antigen/teichoic acid export membrane protein
MIDPLSKLASRIGRHTLIYAGGWMATFAFSFVNVIVLTQFLAVEAFGRLAVLLVLSASLTLLYNLGLLQGSFMWVFGSAGEDAGDDAASPTAAAGHKRRALGTGLLATVGIATAGTLVLVPLAGHLSELLLGDASEREAVVWACASGGVGAVWRLVSNVLRFELRPGLYVVLNNLRPVAVLALSVPAVIAGYGVTGVMAATAVGTGLGILVAGAVTAKNYAIAFDLRHLRRMVHIGAFYVPVIVAIWVVQHIDQLLVSTFGTDEQTGQYRLASRMASVVSYFVSAFLMAWAPLMQTSLQEAVVRDRGLASAGAAIIFYYVLVSLWILVGLVVGADVLVRLAPPEYGAAAVLIPPLAASFTVYGLFIVIYRAARFPRRRSAYSGGAVLGAVVFLGSAVWLIPTLGPVGAALAATLGFGLSCALVLVLSQRGPSPLPLPYARLAGALVVASAAIGLSQLVASTAGASGAAIEIAVVLGFPLALLGLGVVPRRQASVLQTIMRSVLEVGALRRRHLERALTGLDPEERAMLKLLVRGEGSLEQASRTPEPGTENIDLRFTSALWIASGEGLPAPFSAGLADYLLSDDPPAERQVLAERLWRRGIDPSSLDILETTVFDLRRLRPRTWRRVESGAQARGRTGMVRAAMAGGQRWRQFRHGKPRPRR